MGDYYQLCLHRGGITLNSNEPLAIWASCSANTKPWKLLVSSTKHSEIYAFCLQLSYRYWDLEYSRLTIICMVVGVKNFKHHFFFLLQDAALSVVLWNRHFIVQFLVPSGLLCSGRARWFGRWWYTAWDLIEFRHRLQSWQSSRWPGWRWHTSWLWMLEMARVREQLHSQ